MGKKALKDAFNQDMNVYVNFNNADINIWYEPDQSSDPDAANTAIDWMQSARFDAHTILTEDG